MQDLARSIIACEARGRRPVEIKTPADFDVQEKLRPQLATLMGNGGHRALLSRALVLAGAELPWMRGLQVNAEGVLEGLEKIRASLSPEAFLEGKVLLLAELLGLLVAFIGESLTLRLLREVWPKARLNDLDLVKEDNYEKTQ
jgi:hypothetical protein